MGGMERFFNIAGPCVAAKHYMLPATALKQFVRDINGSGERVALYCSLEALQNIWQGKSVPVVTC